MLKHVSNILWEKLFQSICKLSEPDFVKPTSQFVISQFFFFFFFKENKVRFLNPTILMKVNTLLRVFRLVLNDV